MSISLSKGNSISLEKKDGTALSNVVLALGWDAAGSAPKKKGFLAALTGGGEKKIDLDASAILFDANKQVVDKVWFMGKKSKDKSVVHSGDNLTGAGEGDDETIAIDLNRVDAKVQSIVFVITSYSRQTFDQVQNVFARVIDASTSRNEEVVRYDLAERGSNTANVIVKVFRQGNGWAIQAVGNPANGRTVDNVIKDAQAAL